jgi:hypothetical protein
MTIEEILTELDRQLTTEDEIDLDLLNQWGF